MQWAPGPPGCNYGGITSDYLSRLPAKHFVTDYGPDAAALSCTSRSMAALAHLSRITAHRAVGGGSRAGPNFPTPALKNQLQNGSDLHKLSISSSQAMQLKTQSKHTLTQGWLMHDIF